jgi:hypothetical protein
LKGEVDPAARSGRRAGEGAQGDVVKSSALQRLAEEARFPIAGGIGMPMLQAAPPAGAKMRARWGNAVWARGNDFVKSGTGTSACCEHFFARKGQRHPGSIRIGAISVGADAGYCELFGGVAQPPNADNPVWARPRINACTSCVPS